MDLINILITKKVQTKIIYSNFPEIIFFNVFNLLQYYDVLPLAGFNFPGSQDPQKALICYTPSINKQIN